METKLQDGLLFRDMEERDLPACMAIEQESFPDEPFPEWEFVDHMDGANFCAVIVEADEKILGFMLLKMKKREVYIDDIAVAASARGRGVGKALLIWLQQQLPTFGRQAISLHVKETNDTARALYTKVGYREVGLAGWAYEDGSEAIEMVFGERPQSWLGGKLLTLFGARRS